jgi:hypothetical protein
MSETITPSAEFVRHHSDRYEPPEYSQTVSRPYARLKSWWEMLAEGRGGRPPVLNADEAKAARDFDMTYWALMSPVKIIGAYGDQRWNGTPISQLDMTALNSAEFREVARSRLRKAQQVIDDPDVWHAISLLAELGGTTRHVGEWMGARSERTAERLGARTLRKAFTALAIHWGYIKTRERYP